MMQICVTLFSPYASWANKYLKETTCRAQKRFELGESSAISGNGVSRYAIRLNNLDSLSGFVSKGSARANSEIYKEITSKCPILSKGTYP